MFSTSTIDTVVSIAIVAIATRPLITFEDLLTSVNIHLAQ